VNPNSCIYTINDFANSLNKGEEIDALSLEFSKAFDRVPYHTLLLKLDKYGLCLQILDPTLTHQKNTISNTSSDPNEVLSGVPEGAVLVPLLFICFVNDIPQIILCK